jgi:hypothetical protein
VDDDNRCFHYRGYVLMCDPAQLQCGGFRAHAVILKNDVTGNPMASFTQTNVFFLSKLAATEHARDWASRWVDSHWAA